MRAKFTRTHGRQTLCLTCRPRKKRALSAARAATRPDRLTIAAQARARPSVADAAAARWAEVLHSPCPHGGLLRECAEPWCANRVEDFERRGGLLPAKLSATPGEEGGPFTYDGEVVRVARVTRHGLILVAPGRPDLAPLAHHPSGDLLDSKPAGHRLGDGQ